MNTVPVLASIESRVVARLAGCRRALGHALSLAMPTIVLAASLGFAADAWSAADGQPGTDSSAGMDEGLTRQVRALALDATRAAAMGTANAPRIEVSVGQLDTRLRLAPCERVLPYLPEGTRLWGKSRIGLRCTQGSVKWNVYLPVTVQVFGSALVATRSLAGGSVLSMADVVPAEVDLAEEASEPVADAALAAGRMLTRSLKPGQSLRRSHLKPRQWFAAGDTVTVLAQGNGFSVVGEAQALNAGIEGQSVRLRTESGRVLTGLPVGERRVELPL